MMEVEQLRSQSVGELVKLAQKLKGDLFSAQFKHATQQLQKPSDLKTLRRDIARVKTVVTEKLSGSAAKAKVAKAPKAEKKAAAPKAEASEKTEKIEKIAPKAKAPRAKKPAAKKG